ncbi:MAG: DUF6263 family protein [Planctomycetota bacterium]
MSRRLLTSAAILVALAGTTAAQSIWPSPNNAVRYRQPENVYAPVKAELINQGGSVREQLRFSPEVGTIEQFELTMNVQVEIEESESTAAPAATNATSIPVVLVGRCMVIQNKGARNLVSFEITDTRATGNSASDDERTAAMAAGERMRGINVLMEIGRYGGVISSELLIPEGKDATSETYARQIENLFREAIVTVPSQEVGVDATWTTSQTVMFNGIEVERTTECFLESIKDGVATIRVKTMTNASNQAIDANNVPGAADVQLVRQTGDGSGTWEIRFDRILPQRALLTETTERVFESSFEGAAQPMTTTVQSEMAYELRSRQMMQAGATSSRR